jgi:hypothetical protein
MSAFMPLPPSTLCWRVYMVPMPKKKARKIATANIFFCDIQEEEVTLL